MTEMRGRMANKSDYSIDMLLGQKAATAPTAQKDTDLENGADENVPEDLSKPKAEIATVNAVVNARLASDPVRAFAERFPILPPLIPTRFIRPPNLSPKLFSDTRPLNSLGEGRFAKSVMFGRRCCQ